MPKLTIAPNTEAPTDEPTMRMNIIDEVAIPRSFQPTAAWVETIKAVLQNPMPIPFNSAPVPTHSRLSEGSSVINTRLPATRQTPPIPAAKR